MVKLKKTIELVRDELTQLGRKLDAKKNEFSLTKSLVENLEGFPEAIKFLKKNVNWNKNAPLLSDILTCHEKYRVTIENYLENYMNYYIVDNERQAFEAVNILSDAAKGKANFFVLDALDKFEPTPTKIYENAIPASEIVEYEPKYKRLIGHILENVYLLNGGPGDFPIDEEAIFITETGKFTKRKFSISGGSIGLFEGKRIGRAKNLEKLEKGIKELESKILNVKENLDGKQKDLAKLRATAHRSEIEKLQTQFNRVNEEYISVKTKKEQLSHMLSSNTTRREDIASSINDLTEGLNELGPKVEREAEAFLDLETSITELEKKAKTQSELLSEKSLAHNQQNILLHQKQNKVNSVIQEIGFKQSTFDASKIRIEKNQQELGKNEGDIKKLIENSNSNDNDLISMYDDKEIIEKGVNKAEKDYYNQRGDIDVFEKTVREFQKQKEQVDMLQMELQNKLNDTKLELNSVKERLSVEFNIDLDTILKEETIDSGISVEALNEKVLKMRNRLEKMGPINPMAMDAFEEIKARYDFISEQKDDLIKAKESLVQTINEIDVVAKETFLDAFGQIKANFIKVFRSLFTDEDDCDLKLMEPDNPLESPIEIMAKPKGKKPLTINQLSGGEKTLTAISLLFAIYLLKPAPFCIFDEVDAPLDDVNIDKFNHIIKEFSSDSQFIIVTHNKRTMSRTDIIYGITMVEQGVSKVVPVDIRELQD